MFLNTWGHRCAEKLSAFLKYQCDADVICLTEVTDIEQTQIDHHGTNLVYDGPNGLAAHMNGLSQLNNFSATHTVTYGEGRRRDWDCKVTGKQFKDVGFGSALLVRHNLYVLSSGEEQIVFGMDDTHSKVLQWVVYQKQKQWYLVAHFHGVWIKGNTKGDHGIRLEQSRQVREILTRLQELYVVDKVILGGDFNLDITTESLRILCEGESEESQRYTNLIEAMGISNTRTLLYREFKKPKACLYADYILVSKQVKLERFEVRTDVHVSDHAPLIVMFT